MQYFKISYFYRDHANYRQHSFAYFSNTMNRSVEEIEAVLKKHLLDETWFLHYQWDLPDLHFDKTDWENDHPYHELEKIELIGYRPEEIDGSIEELLEKVRRSSYSGC